MNKIFNKNIYTNYKHVLKMNSLAFLKDFCLEVDIVGVSFWEQT